MRSHTVVLPEAVPGGEGNARGDQARRRRRVSLTAAVNNVFFFCFFFCNLLNALRSTGADNSREDVRALGRGSMTIDRRAQRLRAEIRHRVKKKKTQDGTAVDFEVMMMIDDDDKGVLVQHLHVARGMSNKLPHLRRRR